MVITRWREITFLLVYEEKRLAECHPIPENTTLRIGNIYIGRVEKVVKNIRSAFVRLDEEHVGYLSLEEKTAMVLNRSLPKGLPSIAEGDKLLVQVEQEPQKLKQARVTGNISLPGKYAVLDLKGGIGVSKKIRKAERVQALKELIAKEAGRNPDGEGFRSPAGGTEPIFSFGCVLRTACEEAEDAEILAEYRSLRSRMEALIHRAAYEKRTGLLMNGKPEYLAILQEYGVDRIDELLTDLPDVREELAAQGVSPVLYEDASYPLYKLLSLETELERLLGKRVWLKSGGFLVIEPTETMVVIDVNSGKSVGKKNYQTHILNTNLEAAAEIVRQLRLRNLSGMIMVDFINMEDKAHIQQVIDCLELGFQKDKVTGSFVDVTRLGVFELTRRKLRKPLHEYKNMICEVNPQDG